MLFEQMPKEFLIITSDFRYYYHTHTMVVMRIWIFGSTSRVRTTPCFSLLSSTPPPSCMSCQYSRMSCFWKTKQHSTKLDLSPKLAFLCEYNIWFVNFSHFLGGCMMLISWRKMKFLKYLIFQSLSFGFRS